MAEDYIGGLFKQLRHEYEAEIQRLLERIKELEQKS